MRFLFLTPDIPYPLNNGGKIRNYHLITQLAQRHEVTLYTFDLTPHVHGRVEALQQAGVRVLLAPLAPHQQNKRLYQLRSLLHPQPYQYFERYNKAMQDLLTTELTRHRYDIVQVEFAQMGYYDLPNNGHTQTILDQHNVEHEVMYRTYRNEKSLLRKLYNYAEWRKFSRQEIKICRKFDKILTTSARDAQILGAKLPNKPFHVIPNGVDSHYFTYDRQQKPEANSLLFTGSIDYYPNTEGLLYFLHEIWPLLQQAQPDIKFYIAGKNPPPEIVAFGQADPHVIVTGTVNDMRDYHHKAAVVVVPLRIGGGTRLKILEAMAMSRPVVSTTVGAEGIDHTAEENILLADTPEAFSQAVLTLLADPDLRQKMGQHGRGLIEKQYDWQAIATQLEKIYQP